MALLEFKFILLHQRRLNKARKAALSLKKNKFILEPKLLNLLKQYEKKKIGFLKFSKIWKFFKILEKKKLIKLSNGYKINTVYNWFFKNYKLLKNKKFKDKNLIKLSKKKRIFDNLKYIEVPLKRFFYNKKKKKKIFKI